MTLEKQLGGYGKNLFEEKILNSFIS